MSDATGPSSAAERGGGDEVISPDLIATREDFHDAMTTLFDSAKIPLAVFADRAQMHRSQVSRVLAGKPLPRQGTLKHVLQVLGLSDPEIEPWMRALARVSDRQNQPISGTAEAEQAARRDLSEAENRLIAGDELTLPALWRITHARLDYYHQIATGQARQSFRNAQIAMGVGFVLLVVFAVLALTAESTAGAVVTGALGATSAAFAAYISRTFVRSQETAATHLRSYFDQPLQFSRYLAAERLLNGIERLEAEQRAAITTDVVRGMLSVQDTNSSDKPAGGADAP